MQRSYDMKFFVLLDTSGSMEGAKIGALNDAMSNILVTLQGAAFDGRQIELAILTFGKTAQWMYESPKSVMDFGWKELQANGMTPLGLACEELGKVLNACESEEKVGIILLSDGCPTDDYDSALPLLMNNVVFKNSYRYALALGENADIPSLRRFVTDDNVFVLSNVDSLFDRLMTAINDGLSQPASTNNSVHNEDSGDEWD